MRHDKYLYTYTRWNFKWVRWVSRLMNGPLFSRYKTRKIQRYTETDILTTSLGLYSKRENFSTFFEKLYSGKGTGFLNCHRCDSLLLPFPSWKWKMKYIKTLQKEKYSPYCIYLSLNLRIRSLFNIIHLRNYRLYPNGLFINFKIHFYRKINK